MRLHTLILGALLAVGSLAGVALSQPQVDPLTSPISLNLDLKSPHALSVTTLLPSDFAATIKPSTPSAPAPTTRPNTGQPALPRAQRNTAPSVSYLYDWSSTTPAYAQGGLLNGLACSPTALAMVSAHFHQLNPVLGAQTPSEIVAGLHPGAFYPGQGVGFEDMWWQMQALGYRTTTGYTGGTMAQLHDNLANGPVIIIAGGDTMGRQGIHSMVVVGITSDNSQLLINDPATGGRAQLSQATFTRLWAGGSNSIVLIRP